MLERNERVVRKVVMEEKMNWLKKMRSDKPADMKGIAVETRKMEVLA